MKKSFIALICFFTICVFFFRPYFFSHKLLFPSNLLVAYYTPWNTMSFPGWENRIPFKGLGHDNLLIFYPMKDLLKEAIKEHIFPLWTPYNFSGAPFFGDGQSALMYPLTWICALLPLPDAFSIMVILVPLLTMMGTFLLLRHFKLSFVSSLFGSVAFAFSGFMSVWMEENPAVSQSAIWLPFLVLFVDLLITRPKRIWFFFFTVTTAIMMSSGFLQICIYELVFITAFSIFRILQLHFTPAGIWKRIGIVSLGGLTGLLLVAPYLATTWESYKLSPRDFVKMPEIRSIFLVQWSHIISLFNPDWLGNPGSFNYLGTGSYYDKALFIGVIPLFFVLTLFFSKKTILEKFLFWIAAGTMFFGFSSPITQWLFAQPIPILSSMLPSRIFYLSTFALCILSAFGFERLIKTNWYETLIARLRPVASVYLTVIIILELFILVALTEINLPGYFLGTIAHTIREMIVSSVRLTSTLLSVLIRNVAVSIILLLITLCSLFVGKYILFSRKLIPLFLLGLTILSAWYFTNKSLYFGEREFIFPNHPVITELSNKAGYNRIAFSDYQSQIKTALNVPYRLYSPEGLNPVFAYRYGQLIKAATNNGKLTNSIPRIQVDLDLKSASTKEETNIRTTRLINFLGIRYIGDSKKNTWYFHTYPTHQVIWEDVNYRLFENPDAFPKAFVVHSMNTITEPQDIIDAFFNPKNDLRIHAIVEQPIEIQQTLNSTVGEQATVLSYRMNDLRIAVETTQSGLLIVSDTFAPGWRATVDGIPTEVYRSNYIFRGIPIAAGTHTVFMYYQPQSLIYGLYGMCGGFILLLTMLFVLNRYVMSSNRNNHSKE